MIVIYIFRAFFVDVAAFDDKHQHVLMPTSLVTGAIHLVAEKTRDHIQQSRNKDAMVGATIATTTAPPEVDFETPTKYPITTTSPRPTIIDFMAKFKTKRSIDSGKDDFGCSAKYSIADGIGEHVVDKDFGKKADVKDTPKHELEEVANGGLNERPKRSNADNDDNRSTPSPCSASSSCLAFPPKQPKSKCSTGTCDRLPK